ncbi:MAG: YggS family pyridoxal phosphate-dependent enzyme [Paracoccaceae bacterium]|nr:YggS family pyridoxal phosphate-dependent enzyme [Paracoccaceae bacterium]
MSLENIKDQIRNAELTNNRQKGSVNLIAVSKVQPLERVERVLSQGHRIFGENRVQEAYQKWPAWKEKFPTVSLHLLGPLQTNKVKEVLGLFDVVHSLDRDKLARIFSENIQKLGSSPDFFIQVNTGEEEQKAGIFPAMVDKFVEQCKNTYDLPIVGLMCIPPIDEEPSLHFALLKKIAERNGLNRLSMGMSADFVSAITFGSTDVRIGSAIFGRRL